MRSSPLSEDTRKFLLSYVLKNDVELDILRIMFFAIVQEEKVDLESIRRNSIFSFIDQNLLKKLRFNRFISFKLDEYELTFNGFIAIIYLIGLMFKRLFDALLEDVQIAKDFYENGLILSGRNVETHEKLVISFLKNLDSIGLINSSNRSYKLASEENRIEACYKIVKKLSMLGSSEQKKN